MLINIKNVLDVEGESLDIHTAFESFAIDEYQISQIELDGQIKNNAGRIELVLDISYTAKTICARCGTMASLPISFEIDEALENSFIENNNLLLLDIVSQEISLNLPLRFLCQTDCKGLCGTCGANLNNEKCNCDNDKIDERFLMLRQLLNNKED